MGRGLSHIGDEAPGGSETLDRDHDDLSRAGSEV